MSELTLSVPDISCGHCKSSIEEAVGALDGITKVEVAIGDKTVDVAFDDEVQDLDTVIAAIEEQGYEVAR